jgi:hypothetical protein
VGREQAVSENLSMLNWQNRPNSERKPFNHKFIWIYHTTNVTHAKKYGIANSRFLAPMVGRVSALTFGFAGPINEKKGKIDSHIVERTWKEVERCERAKKSAEVV